MTALEAVALTCAGLNPSARCLGRACTSAWTPGTSGALVFCTSLGLLHVDVSDLDVSDVDVSSGVVNLVGVISGVSGTLCPDAGVGRCMLSMSIGGGGGGCGGGPLPGGG